MNKFDKEILSNGENKQIAPKKRMTEKQVLEYIGFTKFKNRLLTIRLVKSLLLTLTVSFIACGVTLILTKQRVWDASPLWSILIMLLCGGITFPCIFLPLTVNNRKLAKMLDSQFALKERMQTSLENADNYSPMSVLLRRDLKEKTSKISSSKIKAKDLFVYIILAVLGLATLISGLVVKQVKDPVEPPLPPPVIEVWELTAEQEAALISIAETVEESDMVMPAKEEIALKVRALVTELKSITDEDEAIDAILLSVAEIDKITDETGSSRALYYALSKKETAFARELARALTRKEKSGYDQKMSDALSSLMHKYDGLEVITKDQQTEMKNDTHDLLIKVVADLTSSLEESGVNKSDALYKMIEKLVKLDDGEHMGLSMVSSIINIVGYAPAKGELENLWSTLLVTRDIFVELTSQGKNFDVGYGASDGIRELFGIPLPQREDLSSEKKESDDDPSDKDDDLVEGPGGYGPGELLGTDELIYDKEHNQSIITYTIYNKYKNILEKLYGKEVEVEGENGEITVKIELPPEMEKYLELLLYGYEGEK